MKDHFMEEVVVKHNKTLNRILYYFSWLVIVVSGLIAAITFSSLTRSLSQGVIWQPILFLAVSGGICAYTFFNHDKILTD